METAVALEDDDDGGVEGTVSPPEEHEVGEADEFEHGSSLPNSSAPALEARALFKKVRINVVISTE